MIGDEMFKKTLVTVAGTLALTVFATGVAHADVTTFMQDMEAAGMTNGDGNSAEIRIGRGICGDLAEGMTVTYEINDMWTKSHLTHEGSVQFISIAVRDLCPSYIQYLPDN
jgi:hypothetical protein